MSGNVDFSEIGLFTTKDGRKITYEGLLSDIYENSEESRNTMKVLVSQLSELIESPADAVVLMEHITSLMDARVKNDDILVKVASILARIIQRGMSSTDTAADWEISEEEKKQLLAEAEGILDKQHNQDNDAGN